MSVTATDPGPSRTRHASRLRGWPPGLVPLDLRLVAAVAAGLAFQVAHALEHLIQVTVWMGSPLTGPFMTPWARALVRGLARAAGGDPAVGMELLHLIGNAVFAVTLVGLAGLCQTRVEAGSVGDWPTALLLIRRAMAVQMLHLAEHVLLIATVLTTGTATGVSTLFGVLEAGTPEAVAVRVLFHFMLNAIPTVLVLQALLHARGPAVDEAAKSSRFSCRGMPFVAPGCGRRPVRQCVEDTR